METVVVNTDRVENYIDMLEDIKRNLNASNANRFYVPKIKNYIKSIDNIQNSIISDLTKLTTYLSEYTSDVKQIERTNFENEIYTANVSDEKLFEVKSVSPVKLNENLDSNDVNDVDITSSHYYDDAYLWANSKDVFWNKYNQFYPNELAMRSVAVDLMYTALADRPPQDLDDGFDDIEDGVWYQAAAIWAKRNGISYGYADNTFKPANNISRAQFITMLWRYAGSPIIDSDVDFNDVDENKYYYNAVKWAVSLGITKGTTRTTFNPDDPLTKAQATTFLYRYKFSENNILVKDISEFDGKITGEYFINNIDVDENGNILSKYGYEAMQQNTKYLQNLINNAISGSTIKIPAGTFYFTSGGLVERWDPVTKAYIYPENYVIHLKNANNIKIEGYGTDEQNPSNLTILKPFSFNGEIEKGLDMFYFNEHKDSGYKNAKFIENVDFSNFVIDSEMTKTNKYTTAGKGFMFNLCKDCDWDNVVVRNTDGTGFGVDMVVNCSIKNCIAYNCGKAATSKFENGASGFGIGTGYSEDESILIENCVSIDNYKYGFFFEHQGRFNIPAYNAKSAEGFVVKNCISYGNYYNFGGERSNDVTYINCTSTRTDNTLKDIHFSEQSRRNNIISIETQENFDDVTPNDYYYDACSWAYNKGVANGISRVSTLIENGEDYTDAAIEYANNNLGVGEPITRADFLDMLWRMKGMQGENNQNGWHSTVKTGYNDVPTHAWYAPSIKWAKDINILNDYGNKIIKPKENITMEEILELLYRCDGKSNANVSSAYSVAEENVTFLKTVEWAEENNILFSENTSFNPSDIVTKEQAIMYLYNYYVFQNN